MSEETAKIRVKCSVLTNPLFSNPENYGYLITTLYFTYILKDVFVCVQMCVKTQVLGENNECCIMADHFSIIISYFNSKP